MGIRSLGLAQSIWNDNQRGVGFMMTRSGFYPHGTTGPRLEGPLGPKLKRAEGPSSRTHTKQPGSRSWAREAHSRRLVSIDPEQVLAMLPLGLASALPPQVQRADHPEGWSILWGAEETDADRLRPLRPLRKLMSYNAENFYQSPKNAHIKSQASIQALADVINQESPDVIALQEVGDKGLLTNFNMKYLYGLYPNVISKPVWVKSQHQLAFMTKGNIRVIDTKSHWKDFCKLSHGAAVRDFLEATFETESGYRFTVFNAHLKSMRGNELKTAPVRLKEASAAAAILRERLTSEPEASVFLTGDLNTHYHSELGRPVIKTLQCLGQAEEEETLSEVFLREHHSVPTNRSSGYPDAKLDYTFTSPALTPLIRQAYVAGSFEDSPWKEASDHLPLVTVFEEGTPQPRSWPEPPSTPLQGERSVSPKRSDKKRKLELIA